MPVAHSAPSSVSVLVRAPPQGRRGPEAKRDRRRAARCERAFFIEVGNGITSRCSTSAGVAKYRPGGSTPSLVKAGIIQMSTLGRSAKRIQRKENLCLGRWGGRDAFLRELPLCCITTDSSGILCPICPGVPRSRRPAAVLEGKRRTTRPPRSHPEPFPTPYFLECSSFQR